MAIISNISKGKTLSSATLDGISFNNIKHTGLGKAFRYVLNETPWQTGDESSPMQYAVNAVDIHWNGAEVDNDVTINTTGELLSWIKNCIVSLQEENQALRDRVAALEQGEYHPEPIEPTEKSYNVLIDVTETPTVEDIIAAIDPGVEKPEVPHLLNMSELSNPTTTYLVYPLGWEIIENDMIVSPVIKDWNGFEIGFSINEEVPTVMVDDVEYRVTNIQLGKGNYTIEFK